MQYVNIKTKQLTAVILAIMQIIMTPIPCSIMAETGRLSVNDDQGNILEPLESTSDTVYTRSSGNEALQGLGRNDAFKGFISTKNDGSGKITFQPTSQYDQVWEELKSETNTLYDLLKEFNDVNSGVGYQFKLKDSDGSIDKPDDITKLKELRKMYKAYKDYTSSSDVSRSYKSIEVGKDYSDTDNKYSTMRVNRLRSLSLAIELQSLKVQSLGGIILPLDLLLITDKRSQDEASKGVTAVIKKYSELESDNFDLNTVDKTLTEAFNSAVNDDAKFAGTDTLGSYDYDNSLYIQYLRSSKPEGFEILTEAFDLVDLWSYPASATEKVKAEKDKSLTCIYAGIGPLYTYVMADYRIANNTTRNKMSTAFTSRLSDRTVGNEYRFGEEEKYTENSKLPTINTMYSQLQFVDNGKKLSLYNTGASPETVYSKIFGGSTNGTEPMHKVAFYYQEGLNKINTYGEQGAVRAPSRFFITGLSNAVDGVDIIEQYFNTLLSATSIDTFKRIMQDRYGYDYSTSSDPSGGTEPTTQSTATGTTKTVTTTESTTTQQNSSNNSISGKENKEKKVALNNWDTNERFTFMYAVNLLNLTEEFYNKFGLSVYTEDLQNSVNDTIDFISEELSDNGIKPLTTKISNKDTPNNQALATLEDDVDKNIVKDFVEPHEWGYELNDDYKELFAWTACFVPFETNLYSEGENLPHVSAHARAKYRKYSRIRQPISIVTTGSNTVNTEGIYSKLLTNSPQKLKYCTLDDFVKSSQSGDTFLFATAVDREEIADNMVSVISADINTNNQSDSNDESSDVEITEDSSEESTEMVERSDSSDDSNDSGISVTASQQTIKTTKLASITSSEKYFGPIYAASNNAEYYKKYKNLIETQSFLDNASYAITEVSAFYNDPEMARSIISRGIRSVEERTARTDVQNNTSKLRTGDDNNDGSDDENDDDDTDSKGVNDNGETSIIEYSMATLMTLQISPQTMYMNYANTFNMLQDKVYLQEGFNNDLHSLLYMDLLGNIVTESGYVVVPAAANATRYTTLSEYPLFNAYMMNSYPDVKQASDDINLEGNDKNKYMIYIASRYLTGTFENITNFDIVNFATIRDYLPNSQFETTIYLADKSDSPEKRLQIDLMEYKSFVKQEQSLRGTMNQRENQVEEAEQIRMKESEDDIDTERRAGIPGKSIIDLPDNRLGVIFLTKNNLLSLRHSSRNVRPDDEVTYGDSEQSNVDNQDGESGEKSSDDLNEETTETSTSTTSNGTLINPRNFKGMVYNIFNFKNSSVFLQGLTYEGVTGNATLDRIPPSGTSYEWLAIKTLNENLYKVWASKPQKVNGVFVDNYINFNEALGIMVATSAGDEDTSVYDSDGTFISGAGMSLDDNNLKDSNAINAIGNLFESIYSPYLAGIETNMLTYAPTLDRVSFTNLFSIILMPLTMVLLVIIAIVLLYMMATLSLKNYNMTLGDIAGSFVLTLLIGIFVINWSLPVSKYVFEEPGTRLMQDDILIQGLYDMENETKDKNHVYFIDETKEFEGSPLLYMGEFNKEDALTYRKNSERPEVDFIFYLPQFDNNKIKVSNSIVMQGTSAYISMHDLFKKSSLKLTRNAKFSLYIIHQLDDDAKSLMYYTPYYNIVEGVTNTVNAYSDSCSGSYNVLNNKLGSTTTGRVKSYIDSIFFISPDDIIQYDSVSTEAHSDGGFVLDKMIDDGDEDSEEYNSTELSTVRLPNGLIVSMDANTVTTYLSMTDKVGDLNDWLEIKRMLYLTDDRSVFSDKWEDSVKVSRWYPNLQSLSDEEIERKIRDINNRTKTFVISNLYNSSSYVSDENLIKLISLKATFEFNKEFGEYFVSGSSAAYPKEAMGYIANNDFYTKSLYIPEQDIFCGLGKQFSYYVSAKSGGVALALITIERSLFILRNIVRNVSLVMFILSLALMYAFYILRNRLGNFALSRATLLTFILCHFNLLDIIQYKIGYYMANNDFSVDAIMFIQLIIGFIYSAIVFILIKKIVILWTTVFKSFIFVLPVGYRTIADQTQYQFDNTSNMSMPSNFTEGEATEVNDYNIPQSDFSDFDSEILVNEIPTATDMLPISNVEEVPAGYNLYSAVNGEGDISYFASKSDVSEMMVPGGLHAHRVHGSGGLTQTLESEDNKFTGFGEDMSNYNMPTGSESQNTMRPDDYI